MKAHPLLITLIALLGLSCLFISPYFYLISLVSLFLMLILSPLPLSKILVSLLASIIFALPVVFMNYFFGLEQLKLNQLILILFRLSLLSLLSIISAQCIDFIRLISFMMNKKIVSAQLGHILLIAWQSLAEIKEEWKRIYFLAQSRNIKKTQYKYLIFSLFVFSIRYSQRRALSLVARGINNDKLYYFSQENSWCRRDSFILLSFFLLLAIYSSFHFLLFQVIR